MEKFKRFTIGTGKFAPWMRDPLIELAHRHQPLNFVAVAPNDLADFIDPEKDDCSVQIIHGPKGAGKSSILLAKRLLLEQVQRNNAIFVPQKFPYIFAPLDPTFEIRFDEWRLVSIYTDRSSWTWLWLVILGAYVIATCEREKPGASDDVDEVVKRQLPVELGAFLLGENYSQEDGPELRDDQFAQVLKTVVRERRAPPAHLERLYCDWILPYFREKIERPVYVFVDGNDELFKGANGFPLIRAIKEGMQLPPLSSSESEPESQRSLGVEKSYDLWSYSQNSLIDVCLKFLSDSHGKVRLMATIRSEAFVSGFAIGKSTQQLANVVKRISYSKEHLAEIFSLNVEQCDKRKLVDPSSNDRIKQFFGQTVTKHWRVPGKEERIIDAIIRHTLENPRDLMAMGEQLYQLDKDDRSKRERASQKVNVTAISILNDYIDFIGEQWDVEMERICFPLIGSNVLSESEVAAIAAEVEGKSNGRIKHPFCYLYRLGLIGIPKQSEVGLTQRFQINENVNERGIDALAALPRATHYLIHPALKQKIAEHRGGYGDNAIITNHQVIVGNGLPWNPHVGVGRATVTLDVANKRLTIDIDGHSLSSAGKNTFSSLDNRPTILFLALLLALADHGSENVSVEQVLEQISELAEKGLIGDTFSQKGKSKLRLNAKDYFAYHIADTSGHPSIIVSINKILQANQLAHFKTLLGEKRTILTLQGLHGHEIVVKGFAWHSANSR